MDRKALLKELAMQGKLTEELSTAVRGLSEIDLRAKFKEMNIDDETLLAHTGVKIFRHPSYDPLPKEEVSRQVEIMFNLLGTPSLPVRFVTKEEADGMNYNREWEDRYNAEIEQWMLEKYSYRGALTAALTLGDMNHFFPLKVLFEHGITPYGISGEEFIVVDESHRTLLGG